MVRARLAIVLAAMAFLIAPAAAEDAAKKGRIGEFTLASEEFDAAATVYRHGDWVVVEFEVLKPLQADDEFAELAVYAQRDDDNVYRFLFRPCATSDRHEVEKLDGGFWKPVKAENWHVARVTKQVARSWRAVVWLDAAALGGSVKETWEFGFSAKSDFENTFFPDSVLSGKGLESVNLANLKDRTEEAELAPEQVIESETRVAAALAKASEAATVAERCEVLVTAVNADPHDPAITNALLTAAIAGFNDPEVRVSYEDVLEKALQRCPGWFRAHEHKLNILTKAGETGAAADYFETWQPGLGRSGARDWETFFKTGCDALIYARRWKSLQRCVDSLRPEDFSPTGLQGQIKYYTKHVLAAGMNDVAGKWRNQLIASTDENAEVAALQAWWVTAIVEAGRFTEALEEAKALLGDATFAGQAKSVDSLAYTCVLAIGAAYDPSDVASVCEDILKVGKDVWSDKAVGIFKDYAEACEASLEDWQNELKYREADKTKVNPRVRFEVGGREVVIELFEDDAPNTVANFVSLVQDGFYENRAFYRREAGWLIQGGGRDDTGASDSEWTIKNEECRRQHWRGTIAMARTMKLDSASTHFFITIGNTKASLDLATDWVVFGRIVEGFDVAQRIQKGDRIAKATAENLRDHEYTPQRNPTEE